MLLTKRICQIVMEKVDHDITWKILGSATSAAVLYGTPEVIEECIITYPDIIWYTGKGFHLSLEAIMQRQKQVYSVIFQSSINKISQASLIDEEEKEISLHKAAKLAPPHRLNVVTGAALQMQQELQWYKVILVNVHKRTTIYKPIQEIWLLVTQKKVSQSKNSREYFLFFSSGRFFHE